MKSSFPWLGPVYQRELFFRAGVDAKAPARDAGDEAAAALSGAIADLLREVREPRPALYAGVEKERDVLRVVELRHTGAGPARLFASVNDGVRECFSGRRRETGIDDEKAGLLEKNH